MSASQTPISFEFFPPRDAEGVDKLIAGTAAKLKAFNPEYCSVTYGAGGATKDGTRQTVQALRNSGLAIVPHLSAGREENSALIALVDEYREQGISQILCLRGDQHSGEASSKRYAADLVHLLKNHFGDALHLAVAGYPEVHPEAVGPSADLAFFKDKVSAGASSAVTQYFYDINAYADFVERCAASAINIPIIPGIMPITDFDALVRFSNKAGADIPRWLGKALEERRNDEASLSALGVDVVTKLCSQLIDLGVPALHFYTLNRWGAATKICRNLGL